MQMITAYVKNENGIWCHDVTAILKPLNLNKMKMINVYIIMTDHVHMYAD